MSQIIPNDKDSWFFPRCVNPDDEKTQVSWLAGLRDKSRNSEEWKNFILLYAPVIRFWCKVRDKNQSLQSSERQDITQVVLCIAMQKIQQVDFGAKKIKFRGWLWTITKSVMIDFFRKKSKEGELLEFVGDMDSPTIPFMNSSLPKWSTSVHSDDRSRNDELVVLLNEIIKQLKLKGCFEKKSWEVFESLFFEGMDSSEVAEKMNMTGLAVRKMKSRILNRIRKELSDLGIDTELSPGL